MTDPTGATPADPADSATETDEDAKAQELLAAAEGDDEGDTDGAEGEEKKPAAADQLGDAGKKALDAMKARWHAERDKRKALATQIVDLVAQREKSTEDAKPEEQPDLDKIREQARNEALTEAKAAALRDSALDKIEAKAAKLFADPEDARALLGSKVDDFIDDDAVDVEAITDALDDLLKKKPHLAAATARRFPASADGGARKSSKPEQLTKQDLKRMKPEEILKAQEEGRLNDLLGVT